MKGNTLDEFVNDILTMGGPEKEFEFRGRRYFLECQPYQDDETLIELVVFECFGDGNYIFRGRGHTFQECFSQFEEAKIFDGKTLYEVEQEIEVIFG